MYEGRVEEETGKIQKCRKLEQQVAGLFWSSFCFTRAVVSAEKKKKKKEKKAKGM